MRGKSVPHFDRNASQMIGMRSAALAAGLAFAIAASAVAEATSAGAEDYLGVPISDEELADVWTSTPAEDEPPA